MKLDTNRVLIEASIRKALRDMESAPERSCRNLIDLGLSFTKGRFQESFLRTAQEMLHHENSAYYALIKDTAGAVNRDNLITFGINLGYHGCTKGARVIRAMEDQYGFNIPWSLSVELDMQILRARPGVYSEMLSQGVSLGIHTYQFYLEGSPLAALPLLQSQPECAFLLFLHGRQIDSAFLRELTGHPNVMVAVYDGDDMPAACKMLRDAGRLYGVYCPYGQAQQQEILSGRWLEHILPARPVFAFVRPQDGCPAPLEREIYAYVCSVRQAQRHPVFLMDLRQDVMAIDEVISEDVCLAEFALDGHLKTHRGEYFGEEYNLFFSPLADIFKGAMKKSDKKITGQ